MTIPLGRTKETNELPSILKIISNLKSRIQRLQEQYNQTEYYEDGIDDESTIKKELVRSKVLLVFIESIQLRRLANDFLVDIITKHLNQDIVLSSNKLKDSLNLLKTINPSDLSYYEFSLTQLNIFNSVLESI